MSSVFNSAFPSSFAPSGQRRRAQPPSLFRRLARWLGLAPERTVRATAPALRRNWDQQKLAMLAAGDKMLARARSDDQPLSMAVFDLADLPELESVFGSTTTRQVMQQVLLRLQAMAGSKGLVTRTDATVFTVLMPGFSRERARNAIDRSMGSPCCFELDADNHEIVLIPDFGLHAFRPDSAPLNQVYSQLRRSISDSQRLERRRQRYLQRERESHTRPAELVAPANRG